LLEERLHVTPALWFSLANSLALFGWVLMTVGLWSRGAWRGRLLWVGGRLLPLLLCAGYAVLLPVYAGTAPDGGFGTLPQVQALFAAPGMALAGWLHFLAFDLLVGRWIVDDTCQRRLPRLAVMPSLVLTFLAGPVGLLLHLALRRPLAPAPAAASGHAG
jgi:hypothetical protein